MTESKRDLHQQGSESGTSRARRRKSQRESSQFNMSQAESPSSVRKEARPRATRRNGPTTREQLVQEQINATSDKTTSIQGKLSSKLGLSSPPSRSKAGARSRRSEALFEATAQQETQRITSREQTRPLAKNHRVFEAHSDAAPPVMVRGGMGGMAFGRVANSRLHKQRSPKRRIDVPLRVTGAEVRLPSIPMVSLGWRSISLFMVILMIACLMMMWKAPLFQAGSVQAQGMKRVTVSDLNVVMGTFGRSVFSLNPGDLREAISQAFPELTKISVRVGLPASVKVVATERQPVISWMQDGVESWVDAEGYSFPVRGVVDAPLVVVEGFGIPPGTTQAATMAEQASAAPLPSQEAIRTPSMRLSSEQVSAILALGAKMPPETALVFDSQRGLGWNDPNGWEVFFGDENQDMEMKMAVYQALVDQLKSEGIQPALISVEYVHAPYYRMER